ncbi:MAG: hypothetical protein DMF63_10450 [Acidobacteria bacterium]|nr:MAG: hypothetical protein DMF63_10450 [Acidobacteriota bacterium]
MWLLLSVSLLVLVVIAWLVLVALRRNPLPFPDPGSRIFSAASIAGKDAIVELLKMYGIKERFRADTDGVRRSIMWDGTIINLPSDEVSRKLNSAAASIGLVAEDPAAGANAAADFLRSRGFTAEVVLDVEPELPIVFVTTNAMKATVINFRKHMIHLPRPK